MIPILPETAPFAADQRAWLNGFFSAVYGIQTAQSAGVPAGAAPGAAAGAASGPDDNLQPFHDASLAHDDRVKMSEGMPLRLRMMAAMAQQDCGQCGYLCKTYAAALHSGAEKDPNKCVPGGKPTSRLLKQLLTEPRDPADAQTIEVVSTSAPTPADPYHRDMPFLARLRESQPLTGETAEKTTQSVVLSLEGSGLEYVPGDSLGVYPENDHELVNHLLSVFDVDGSEPVTLANGTLISAREALSRRCDLLLPSDELLDLMARSAADPAQGAALRRLAEGAVECADEGIFDVYDLLNHYPSSRPLFEDFVRLLNALPPRLYSIASSHRAHPGEVHLCVSVVKYEAHGRRRRGVASTFLSERMKKGGKVGVYLQRSHGFHLPANPKTPVIMVGPGTGIAPFRAFLEERHAQGNEGKNWLFFGAPKASTDFLYKDQLQGWLDGGTLTKLTTAFSRDQAEKVYVQNRMAEQKEEIWRWLNDEKGHLYICGDAKRMAADVEKTLTTIVADQGKMDMEAAGNWVRQLGAEGRFLKDVY